MSRGNENRGGGSHRLARVEREIREVIGLYLISGFRGELPGIVTVSRVQMSGDLRQGRVLITLMPHPGAEGPADGSIEFAKLKKAAISELQAHAHEIQSELNRKLRLRFVPKISFSYDEGFDRAMRVENVLRGLNVESTKSQWGDAQAGTERMVPTGDPSEDYSDDPSDDPPDEGSQS
jgi:ribosome-binding factor A